MGHIHNSSGHRPAEQTVACTCWSERCWIWKSCWWNRPCSPCARSESAVYHQLHMSDQFCRPDHCRRCSMLRGKQKMKSEETW